MNPLKKLPASERPRERLAKLGESAISLTELIAIILGRGTKEKPVLELSAELIAAFPDLQALADASIPELLQIKGIGEAKAIQLKAAFALGKKLLKGNDGIAILLDSPGKVFQLIRTEMPEGKEAIMALLRDAKGQLIHREIIGIGTVSEVLMHPREIFHLAVKHRASSVIIAHNHPSGDPKPSERDQEMTKLLSAASGIIGIPLIDHIIVGKKEFVSLRSRGLLPHAPPYR